jgi:gas vesicle protein
MQGRLTQMAEKQDTGQERKGGGRRGVALAAGIIGSVIGATAALLLSPWRGKEAREKVREGASKAGAAVKERASKAGAAVKEKAQSAAERLRKEESEGEK